MVKEYLNIAIKSLRTRPLRSWLTILGIVIGVFLVISLVSLSEGIKQAALKELKMMGKDVIMIFPGEFDDFMTTMVGGVKMTDEDVTAISRAQGVDLAVPTAYKGVVIRYEGKKKMVLLYGIPLRDGLDFFKEDMGWSITDGRWPIPGKREVFVGQAVANDIFPNLRVGDSASINGQQFEIVGILRSLGNKQDDSMVSLDLPSFRQITGEREGAQFVMARAKPGYNVDEVVENIKDQLSETRKRRRGEDLPSYSVLSSEKVAGIVGNIMGLIQAMVFALASIAIVVGGIGIMNTMYTSVHERTKEIGIMKAVGAKRSTINLIFLIESGMVGLIGGAGGVLLGIILAKAIEIFGQIHPVFYLEATVSWWLILFGLGFSFLIGCVSGFLPARKASKLKPVDALRYE